MGFMSFSLDQLNLPLYQAEDEKYRPLGTWIIGDISIYKIVCLDALAMLADVSAGRPPFVPWDSENYTVNFAPTGVSIQNNWVEGELGATFTIAEVREAVEDYWRFLASIPENPDLAREYRPDLPEWQADLLRWEEKWSRRHPYHGVLF